MFVVRINLLFTVYLFTVGAVIGNWMRNRNTIEY